MRNLPALNKPVIASMKIDKPIYNWAKVYNLGSLLIDSWFYDVDISNDGLKIATVAIVDEVSPDNYILILNSTDGNIINSCKIMSLDNPRHRWNQVMIESVSNISQSVIYYFVYHNEYNILSRVHFDSPGNITL